MGDENDKNGKNGKSVYDYLIKARNHHYTQYHIWMLFFITINGGLFIAYSNLLKDGTTNGDVKMVKIAVLLLGYIAALSFYLSSKGYHYWNTNFSKLIRKYENRPGASDDEKAYSCIADQDQADDSENYFCPTKGANISTTKIISLFALAMTYGWGILLVVKILLYIYNRIGSFEWLFERLLIIIVAIGISYLAVRLVSCVAYTYLKSDTTHHSNVDVDSKKQDAKK